MKRYTIKEMKDMIDRSDIHNSFKAHAINVLHHIGQQDKHTEKTGWIDPNEVYPEIGKEYWVLSGNGDVFKTSMIWERQPDFIWLAYDYFYNTHIIIMYAEIKPPELPEELKKKYESD